MPLKHFICLEYLRGLLYRNSVPYRITVRIDVIANILRLLIEFFFFFFGCVKHAISMLDILHV